MMVGINGWMGSLVASAWGLPALHVVSAGMLGAIGLWPFRRLGITGRQVATAASRR
jgi:hypothetical protein